jgi:hypothetical protein
LSCSSLSLAFQLLHDFFVLLQSERGLPTVFGKGKDQNEEKRKKKHKHRSKDRDKDKDKDKKRYRDKDKKRDKDKDKDRSKGENGEKRHKKKVLGSTINFCCCWLM